MDELKLLKLEKLLERLYAIPGKLLITFLAMEAMYWHFDMSNFTKDLKQSIFVSIIFYGIFSFFWICIKMTHNWLVGIILGVVLLGVYIMSDTISGVLSGVLAIALMFGGAIWDIANIVRYILLRISIAKG